MKVREAGLCFVIEHFRLVKDKQNKWSHTPITLLPVYRLTEIPLTHLKTNGSDFPNYLMVTRFDALVIFVAILRKIGYGVVFPQSGLTLHL